MSFTYFQKMEILFYKISIYVYIPNIQMFAFINDDPNRNLIEESYL